MSRASRLHRDTIALGCPTTSARGCPSQTSLFPSILPLCQSRGCSAGGWHVLGDTTLLLLLVLGAAVWVLITYIAPVIAVLDSPVRGGRRWLLAGYYFALQIPIYWVYSTAWHLEYAPADQTAEVLSLFALQFVQPFLWFR